MPALVLFRGGIHGKVPVQAHRPESGVPEGFLQYLRLPGPLMLPFIDPAVTAVLIPHKKCQVKLDHFPVFMPGVLPQISDILPVFSQQPAAQNILQLVGC